MINKPAVRAEKLPGMKLTKPKAPDCVTVQPTNPPIEVAKTPTYGPKSIPITGAKTAPRVMNLPNAPIIGNSDTNEKMAYKAAKMHINASFLDAKCSLTPRLDTA